MAITLDGADNKIEIGANATGPSSLRLFEDTDNGTNYVSLIAPTTLASNRTVTLPDADGTVLTSGNTVTVAQGGTGATSLTANNVILGNGTSAVQFVAPGSNGNVLTSNGTTWVSQALAVSGGPLVYLNSATASSSVVDFTGLDTSTYKAFYIVLTDVLAASFSCRLYIGGSFITTNTYNTAGVGIDNTTSGSNIGSYNESIIKLGNSNTVANNGVSGNLWLYPAGGVSNVFANLFLVNTSSGVFVMQSIAGGNNSSTVATGIRFCTQAGGNLTGGSFWIYGLKAS